MKRKIKTDVERKAIKKEQDKMYRLVNKEEIKEYKKKWYLNNKVKTIENSKNWYSQNKTKRMDTASKYYLNNKEKIKNKSNMWYLYNKDNVLEKHKKNYLENIDEERKKLKKYYYENVKILSEKRSIKRIEEKIHAMNILGGIVCKHCGCVDIRYLQIDHIHTNSKNKREKLITNQIHKNIIKNPEQAKLKYQVLCGNCNTIKRSKNDECLQIINPTDKQLLGRVKNRKGGLKLRKSVMLLLGGVFCKTCGFSNYDALQIDHIHGGGTKEIKKYGHAGIYRKIINDPSCRCEYQVLCVNCNWIKRIENNEIYKKYN